MIADFILSAVYACGQIERNDYAIDGYTKKVGKIIVIINGNKQYGNGGIGKRNSPEERNLIKDY
ncbi:MAG: hypothetical protein M0R51_08785, partial [Clostridia bacterium]|nr:hypothetical protein [Clostridia bacterium]